MKRTVIILIILSLMFMTLPLTAADKDDVKTRGRALTGISLVHFDQESSKFFEYRDVPSGFIFSVFDFRLENPDLYMDFTARGIQQSDERYDIGVGRYGKFKIDFQWDKTPHRYSFDARTLYNEGDPGVLFLSDQIQSGLQNTVGTHGQNFGNGVTMLSGFLTGAHPTDLGIIRKRGSFNMAYSLSDPLTLNVKIDREKKEGTRAIGGVLGYGNIMELPEPVDHLTTQVEARLSYAGKKLHMNAGYYISVFDNNISGLTWDNPYRLTDQTDISPFAYFYGNASASGRMSLPPSNSAQEIFFNGSFRIANKTKLNAALSYGMLSQKGDVLPYTVNTGIADSYSAALSSPAGAGDIQVNTASANLSLNSRPFTDVVINAGYKFFSYDNTASGFTLPGYALMDQVWIDSPLVNQPYGYKRSSVFGSVSVSKIKNSLIRLGYKYKSIERESGSDDNGKTSEGIMDLSLNTNPLSWLSFTGSYTLSNRTWSLEGKKDLYLLREAGSFNFRRYHEADRDRNALNLLMTLSLFKNLDLSASYIYANDEYENSEYGLKSNDFNSYILDLNYRFSNHSIFLFYSNEKYSGFQSARETSKPPYDTISLNPNDDWSADLTDTIDTIGAGLNLNLKKDKLKFKISFTYSKAEGAADFTIPEGNISSATAFDQGLDSSTLVAVKAKLVYRLNSRLSLILGHWYEQFELDDITRNDLQVDMLNNGFAFYLGALEPDYKYNVTYLQVLLSW